jgi:NodT family efflux transporter outer membrane factor (OMF) lipoprotein
MRNTRIRMALILGLITLAAGCAVGPEYVRPKIDAPAAFKEAQNWKQAQPKDDQPHAAWWEIYADAQLNTLMSQIAISNQNVLLAEANYRRARALIDASQASYFPTVGLNAASTRSHQGNSTATNNTGTATGTNAGNTTRGITRNNSLSAAASWEPDIWGKVRRTVELNTSGAEASAADLANAQLSAQAELAQDYFQLRAQDTQKKLLDDTVAAYEKSLQLTKNRYAAGVVAKADVVQADTQLKTTQAQSIDLEVQRAQFEHAIAVLIGKAPAEFSLSVAPLNTPVPVLPVAVPSALLERRPDIAAAERMVASANAQIGIATAAFFPNLTLNASGGYQSSSFSKWLSAPYQFWSLGPQIAATLFDGGARRAQVRQAEASYEASVASYRQTVLSAFQAIEDDLVQLRVLQAETEVQKSAVAAAEEALALTLNQYKAGTVSYLNVITAQASALGNRRSLAQLDSRRLVVSVLLVRDMGGGWDAQRMNDADKHPTQ